ncbi:MAG: LCP family protein [bacterium]|nr:LCP family protein [bacterium]
MQGYRTRQRPVRPRARRGCIWQILIVGLSLFACMLGLCSMLTLGYFLFPPQPLDILILGLDSREGEGFATRTDSIMLLGVNPRGLQASLLSIPRDLFINVPGYGEQRINTVNVLGELEAEGRGPQLLAESVALSFGVEIDRYARLDFDAFVELIDAIGGVTIDVENLIVDDTFPTADYGTISVRFEPGRQHMDGATALIYARTRHGDDDFARAARQQQVLSAVADKLANPLYWPGALSVLLSNTDTNLTLLDMPAIAPALLLSGLDRRVIDREAILGGENGAVPNYDLLRPWIDERFN